MATKIKIIGLIFLIVIILVFMNGCNAKKDNIINEKINSEIIYINKELVEIANFLNNIDNLQYRIVAETPENKSKSSGEEQLSNSEKQNKSESENTGKAENKSEETKEDGNGNSEDIKGESNKESKIFVLDEKNVLDNEIDWNKLVSKIEILYTSWPVIANDLKYIGVNEKDINSFGENIDILVILCKEKNKNQIINTIVDMYEYLPKFVYKIKNNAQKQSVLECKLNVLKCYRDVSNDEWDNLGNSLNLLRESFEKCKNNYNGVQEKKHNVDICDVIVGEMSNTEFLKDKTILYIKYKNLMSELEDLF